jgi:16S rRNA (guanine966-N2)-methyltransferase
LIEEFGLPAAAGTVVCMRVIAGRMGGRRLKAPRGKVTRPTSDRVREALFGLLGEVRGAVVLDLFAGTGGLGIEALSRGAERAVFVERDGGAVRALQANLATLELAPAEAEVRQFDALAALRTARGRKETYDLVFIDPPYSQTHDLGAEISAVLPSVLSPAARVVVESDRRAPLQIALALERERRYGDTQITIHRHQ